MGTAYVNGRFLPIEAANVSVLDRGFLFGDGVYEVIPVFGGVPFRLDEHLDRLDYSLAQCRIPAPMDRTHWAELFARLIRDYGGGDQAIYLQVTRGVAPSRDHRFPEDPQPTVVAWSRAIPQPPEQPPESIACVLLDDIRWSRCDIKSVSLLGNVLLTQRALEAGAREALLVRDGCVWEGASSNLFAVIDGQLVTPPKGPRILAGITRDLVLEQARVAGVDCAEAPITEAALRGASEIWITSSTREMVPVARLDEQMLEQAPGPVFLQVWKAYRRFRQAFVNGGGA